MESPNRFALHDAVPHDHGDAAHHGDRLQVAEAGQGRRASMRRPSALITPALAMEIAEREKDQDEELDVDRVSSVQADHFLDGDAKREKPELSKTNSERMAADEAIEKLDSENALMDDEFDDERNEKVIHTRSRMTAPPFNSRIRHASVAMRNYSWRE